MSERVGQVPPLRSLGGCDFCQKGQIKSSASVRCSPRSWRAGSWTYTSYCTCFERFSVTRLHPGGSSSCSTMRMPWVGSTVSLNKLSIDTLAAFGDTPKWRVNSSMDALCVLHLSQPCGVRHLALADVCFFLSHLKILSLQRKQNWRT